MAKEIYSEEIMFCGRKIRLVLVEYELPTSSKIIRCVKAKTTLVESSDWIVPKEKTK